MTASAKPTTPTMKLPLRETVTDPDTETFIKQVSRLTLSQVVERVTVTERLSGRDADDARLRKYTVLLEFYPPEEYRSEYKITSDQLHESLAFSFAARLKKELVIEMRDAQKTISQDLAVGVGLRVRDNEAAENEDAAGRRGRDDELDNDDGDAYQLKRQAQARQHEYEADDGSESGIADLEDYVEQQMSDDEEDGRKKPTAEGDEGMDIDANEKAQADAKADALAETFRLASKYATSFSFDVHGGKSAQFDLEVSLRLWTADLTSSFRRARQSSFSWISWKGRVELRWSMKCQTSVGA